MLHGDSRGLLHRARRVAEAALHAAWLSSISMPFVLLSFLYLLGVRVNRIKNNCFWADFMGSSRGSLRGCLRGSLKGVWAESPTEGVCEGVYEGVYERKIEFSAMWYRGGL